MKKSSAGDVNKGQQLQGLPAELLDAVLRQLDASSQLQVFMTSKFLTTALLRICPRIQLTYPTQHDIIGEHLRELAPFLTEVLQNRRQPKLDLTLQPASSLTDAIKQRGKAEPAAAAADATRMVAWMLGAVPLCGAVDCLTIEWHHPLDLPWEPDFSAALAASFPSLTSLAYREARISIGDLANAINHPLLLPRLLHLDLEYASITHEGDLGRSPFIGSRLQTLSLNADVDVDGEDELLYGLLPLPLTLTELEVKGCCPHLWDWVEIGAAVSSLTQLQKLWLSCQDILIGLDRAIPGVVELLPALAHLPSLHTLKMNEQVVGQEQLDALLALTQITSLEVLEFSGLTSSRASAACSWRQLEVRILDWVTAAYLPMHSLTHPLWLHQLEGNVEEPSIELLAAAEHNLCERNKAGLVLDGNLCLSKATVDLLTEQYLTHRCHTAHQPPHPTVASSSSYTGPSTSLVSSSSPEGHITAGGPGSSTGQGVQQGEAAGAQALMQRLGHYVEVLYIIGQGLSKTCLSAANRQALAVLFPVADVKFS